MVASAAFGYGILLPKEWVDAQKELMPYCDSIAEIVAHHGGIKHPHTNADTNMWHRYSEKVDEFFKSSPWKNFVLIEHGDFKRGFGYMIMVKPTLQRVFNSEEPESIVGTDLSMPRGIVKKLKEFCKDFDIITDHPNWYLTVINYA